MEYKMYKSVLSFCVIGCMSTSVFAENSFLSILQSKHTAIQKSQKTLPNRLLMSGKNYADFSGNWSGTCTFEHDEPTSITTKIYNTDGAIDIDGTNFWINGTNTTSQSGGNVYESEQTKVYWNDNRQTLIMDGIFIYNAGFSSDMVKYFTKGTISLNNGDLILEITNRDDTTQTDYTKCVLKKSND